MAPDGTPTADQVILAHQRATQQCELLGKHSYELLWESTTRASGEEARTERVLHQGIPGVAYTRLHQQREPAVRFVAFGKTSKGDYWSASDGGVQPALGEEAAAQLSVGLDPTPTCNHAERWTSRELIGAEERDGVPVYRVRATFRNGTTQDLLFHRDDGLLLAVEARSDAGSTVTEYSDYALHAGVKWPTREVAKRTEGDLSVETSMALLSLETDLESYSEIGPRAVAAILAEAARSGAQP